MKNEDCLVVISGPSGVGKGTVVKKLVELHPEIAVSVSATTRKPRKGEVDGIHYHFLTDAQFEQMITQNKLVEYAGYVNHYYGTPKAEIEDRMERGQVVILEIDVQGGFSIKKQYPGAMTVFVTPPSMEELRSRLIGRESEDAATVSRRLQRAEEEMKLKEQYDAQVCNIDPEGCAEEIYGLIRQHRKQ